MGLLGSNYRQVQEQIKRLATDSSFDNSGGRLRLKCDGTRAETRYHLSAKRTSWFKNQRGHQFSWLLAAEVCASVVVMLDTPCSKVVWRVLATHSIHQFPLHFPSRASPCAITFQLDSTTIWQERKSLLNQNAVTLYLMT